MAYTYDLATHKVGSWGPAGGGMWGRSGPAVSKDLVMYTGPAMAVGSGEMACTATASSASSRTRKPRAWTWWITSPSNAEWLVKRDLDMQVTPANFRVPGKEYMIDASKECRIYLMDTDSIGGDDHRTPAYRTQLICNEIVDFAEPASGVTATWEDNGTRWILTSFWAPSIQVQGARRVWRSEEGAIAASRWDR